MKKIDINTEFIKLDQFLKLAGLANTGGHAKIMINEGEVKVNGKICNKRGRKLRNNDEVTIDGNSFTINKL